MTPLRPIRSANSPAKRPPIKAPSDVEEVISDLSQVVTGFSGVDSDGARCSRAADIEAVSSVGDEFVSSVETSCGMEKRALTAK